MSRRKAPQLPQSQSQNVSNIVENPPQDEITELANKCVKFIIYRSHNNIPVKKSELKKHVLPNTSRSFEGIMEKASEIFEDVYGFKLVACDEPNGNTSYVTVQTMEDKGILNDPNEEVPADSYKILIMFVLSNIFMSEEPVNEAAMFLFLNSIGINVDTDNGMFGNVKDFVNNTMVKQNYITLVTDPLSKEITYKWGPRSDHTISKHRILEFMSAMYDGRPPTAWGSKYQEANEQFHNTDVGNQDANVE